MREAANKIAAAKAVLRYAERKAQPFAQSMITEADRLLTEAEGRLKP